MKIYIGPYKNWWGPYQIAELLQFVGFSEKRCEKIGEWLNSTCLLGFCEWIHARKKRTVKIRIDNYDIWGMDHTLAMIVVPMLKLLKEKKQGAPHVDDEDVPEHLRSTNAKPSSDEFVTTDEFWFDRWDYIIDEIVWSFEQILDEESESKFYKDKDPDKPSNEPGLSFKESMNRIDVDSKGLEEYHDRIQKGMCLFGKYLRGMWD